MPPRMIPAWEVPEGPHHATYGALPHDIDLPDVSVWQLLVDAVTTWPERPAVKFPGCTLTWRELRAEVEMVAAGLEDLGVGHGDRVALDLQNCPQFVIAYFAVMRLDAVAVPVNPMYRGGELAHIITDSGASVVLATVDVAPWVCAAADSVETRLTAVVTVDLTDMMGGRDALPTMSIPEAWKQWLSAPAPEVAESSCRVITWTELRKGAATPSRPVTAIGIDIAQIGYTSGTSGAAKGCVTLHSALVHQALCASLWHDVHPGDASLIVIPMFHATGLVMGLLNAVAGGATSVILPRWDRDHALRTIVEEKVSHWFNVPTMVIDLLAASREAADAAMSQLRLIGGGGSAMPKPVEDRLRDQYGLNYCTGYGMTETSSAISIIPLDAPRSGTVGVPYLGTDVRIIAARVGPGVGATPLPTGEQGEIVVSGPQVSPGYWKNPEATAESTIEIDGKEFLRTGDIGFLDEDGYLTLTERLKRLINAAGFKVSPAEVEQVLYDHEAIREACVIRMAHERRGESVKAVVVLQEGWAGRVTEDDIIAWSKERLATYKYPRSVDFVDSLPHSAAGKLMWREVQDEYDARAAQSSSST